MLGVRFQKRKLLVGAASNWRGEGGVLAPKGHGSAMAHGPLERQRSAVFLVFQGLVDEVIQPARFKVGLNARVDGLRAVLVQPGVQFFQFLRRE